MTSRIGANVVVSGVLQLAAEVARNRLEHARDLAKGLLHTPETARAKSSLFSHSVLIINTGGTEDWMGATPESRNRRQGPAQRARSVHEGPLWILGGLRGGFCVCYIVRHEIRDESCARRTAHRSHRRGGAPYTSFYYL